MAKKSENSRKYVAFTDNDDRFVKVQNSESGYTFDSIDEAIEACKQSYDEEELWGEFYFTILFADNHRFVKRIKLNTIISVTEC